MLSRLKYFCLLLLPLQVWADLTIFDVRKNLPMSDTDPIYRDFIINGGSEAGLSVGMVLTVQRRIPLYDSYQNRSAGDLQLKVARVKLIHVQKGLAVARLQSEFTREGTPLLDDNFIMVGDHVDLSSATSNKKADNSGLSDSPKSASAAPAAPAAPPPLPPSSKASVQIVVNSVDVSKTTASVQTPAPPKVEPPPVKEGLD